MDTWNEVCTPMHIRSLKQPRSWLSLCVLGQDLEGNENPDSFHDIRKVYLSTLDDRTYFIQ